MKIFARRNQTKVPVKVAYKGGTPSWYAKAYFRIKNSTGTIYSQEHDIRFILRHLRKDDNYVSEVPANVNSRSDVNKKVLQACMDYLTRAFGERWDYEGVDFEVIGLDIIEKTVMRTTPIEYMFPED